MKTRLLIIIVITLLAVSITYVSFAYNQEIKLATGMMERENDPCFENYGKFCEEGLQRVLDHCQKKELAEGELVIYYEDTVPFYHHNTTHYIGTNSCQWHLLENHPDSDILCIPGIEKWVSSEAIRNSTHIYDKSTCQWYRIMSFGDPVYPVPDWEPGPIPEPRPELGIQGTIILSILLFGIIGCLVGLFIISRKRK